MPTFDEVLGRVPQIENFLSGIFNQAEGMNAEERKELEYAVEDIRLAFNEWLKRLEKEEA